MCVGNLITTVKTKIATIRVAVNDKGDKFVLQVEDLKEERIMDLEFRLERGELTGTNRGDL